MFLQKTKLNAQLENAIQKSKTQSLAHNRQDLPHLLWGEILILTDTKPN